MTYYRVEVQTAGSGDIWSGNGLCYSTPEAARESGLDLMMRWTAVRNMRVAELTAEDVEERGLSIRKEPTLKGWDHRVQL